VRAQGRRLDAFDLFGRHPRSLGDEDLFRREPPWTKAKHPYSYCPFTIWGVPSPSPECNGSEYDDRLSQWDHDKYERLKKQHYHDAETGNYLAPFSSNACKGDRIEAFLRDWYDDPALKLLRVIEYCQPYSGYPTWRFDFKKGTRA